MKNLILNTRKIELTTAQTIVLVVLAIAVATLLVLKFGHASMY